MTRECHLPPYELSLCSKAVVAWAKVKHHDKRNRIKGPIELMGKYALARDDYTLLTQQTAPTAIAR